MYDNQFAKYNLTVAQILLTKVVIESESRVNVINTFQKLLEHNVIPIVNENDTVAIDELLLEVGENDSLAAIVAHLSQADLLIILSDIDGLYDKDPHSNPDAKLIPVVEEITDEIRSLAGVAGTNFGKGGMITKINAADIAKNAGIDMVIMNGSNPENLYNFFEGKQTGTLFKA